MKVFYTYLWLREDGTPYYAGKGSSDRAYINEGHTVRKPKSKDRILIQEFPDEKAAFAAEAFLISFYGRQDLGTGCLRNLTDGGEGSSGYSHSPEALKKIGEASKGNKHNRGRKASPETLAKLSEAHKGNKSFTGQKLSEDHKKHISDSLREGYQSGRLKCPHTGKNWSAKRRAAYNKKYNIAEI